MTDVEMMFSYDGWNFTFTEQLRNDIDSMPDQPTRQLDVLKKFLNIIERQSQEIQQLKDKSEFENRNVDNQDEVYGKSERVVRLENYSRKICLSQTCISAPTH